MLDREGHTPCLWPLDRVSSEPVFWSYYMQATCELPFLIAVHASREMS
jgi:hypothetical protein